MCGAPKSAYEKHADGRGSHGGAAVTTDDVYTCSACKHVYGRPPSDPGYSLFYKERKAEVKDENPGFSGAEITQELAQMWAQLDTDAQEEYRKKAHDKYCAYDLLECLIDLEHKHNEDWEDSQYGEGWKQEYGLDPPNPGYGTRFKCGEFRADGEFVCGLDCPHCEPGLKRDIEGQAGIYPEPSGKHCRYRGLDGTDGTELPDSLEEVKECWNDAARADCLALEALKAARQGRIEDAIELAKQAEEGLDSLHTTSPRRLPTEPTPESTRRSRAGDSIVWKWWELSNGRREDSSFKDNVTAAWTDEQKHGTHCTDWEQWTPSRLVPVEGLDVQRMEAIADEARVKARDGRKIAMGVRNHLDCRPVLRPNDSVEVIRHSSQGTSIHPGRILEDNQDGTYAVQSTEDDDDAQDGTASELAKRAEEALGMHHPSAAGQSVPMRLIRSLEKRSAKTHPIPKCGFTDCRHCNAEHWLYHKDIDSKRVQHMALLQALKFHMPDAHDGAPVGLETLYDRMRAARPIHAQLAKPPILKGDNVYARTGKFFDETNKKYFEEGHVRDHGDGTYSKPGAVDRVLDGEIYREYEAATVLKDNRDGTYKVKIKSSGRLVKRVRDGAIYKQWLEDLLRSFLRDQKLCNLMYLHVDEREGFTRGKIIRLMGFDRTHLELRAHGKHAEYTIDNRCEFGGDVHGAEKLIVKMLPVHLIGGGEAVAARDTDRDQKEETVAYGEDRDGWFACEGDELDPLPPVEAELQMRKQSTYRKKTRKGSTVSRGRKGSTVERARKSSTVSRARKGSTRL